MAYAGGVICAAVEYHGGAQAAAFGGIAEKIGRNTSEMCSRVGGTTHRPGDGLSALALTCRHCGQPLGGECLSLNLGLRLEGTLGCYPGGRKCRFVRPRAFKL